MLRCFYLLIFLSLGIHFSHAQDFRKGYVRLQGEDKQGLIGKIVGTKPEAIEFKATDSSEVVLYSASDVIGYHVNGIFYTSFLNPGDGKDWIFVDLLVTGELSLIRRGTMYFILQRGSTVFIHLDHKHRKTLNELTEDCPWVSARAGKIGLNREDLAAYINEYNTCVAGERPNAEGMPRVVSVALYAGTDYTGVKFDKTEETETRFLAASKLRDRSLPQFGVDVTFKTHKISNLVGFYAGAFYNSNSYHAVTKLTLKSWTEVSEYSIDYTEMRIPLGFEFKAPSRRALSYYMRAGVMFVKTLDFQATHPTYEVDPFGDGTIYYLQPSQFISFDRNIAASGSLGMDYKVFSNSHIRLQGTVTVGSVDAKVRNGNRDYVSTGRLSSYSLMLGFVF